MRKVRALVLLLPMLLLIDALIPVCPVYASPSIAIFGPSDDSYVDEQNPAANYGSISSFTIGELGIYRYYGLVRFDLSSYIPSGATITSATLKLYFYVTTASSTVSAYRIKDSWSEGTVKWINQPGHEATATASTYVSSGGWKTWNVTADVQKFVSGTKPNYGWKLITTGALFYVCSKEYPLGTGPLLEVTYKLPTTITVDTDPRTVNKIGSEIIGSKGI